MFDAQQIREHMVVVDDAGNRIGRVDRVEGASIKLTRDTPAAHAQHRYVPLDWVSAVDVSVHLSRPAREVENEWSDTPLGAGA